MSWTEKFENKWVEEYMPEKMYQVTAEAVILKTDTMKFKETVIIFHLQLQLKASSFPGEIFWERNQA